MAEKQTPLDELTYEQALAELEEIVTRLESDPPSLEECARLYERGRALTRRCASLLDAVELRLRTLGDVAAGDAG